MPFPINLVGWLMNLTYSANHEKMNNPLPSDHFDPLT